MNEDRWREFLLSADHAGRYLMATGSIEWSEAEAPSSDCIGEVYNKLRDKREERMLVRLYYLLRPRVEKFILYGAPHLLRSASQVTAPRLQVSKDLVKGKIDWNKTLRYRNRGGSSTSWVCRRYDRSHDCTENRLLKNFLWQVEATCDYLSPLIDGGRVGRLLKRMQARCGEQLRSPHLREITAFEGLTPITRARARRNKNPKYRELLDLAVEFDECVQSGKWDAIVRLLSAGWFEPIETDDLFELYSLALVVDVLEKELGLGRPKSYGLVRAGRAEVVSFRSRKFGRVTVFFDQAPPEAGGVKSRYKNVLASRGIRGAAHRPDIMIVAGREPEQKLLILECKKTEDLGYTRDSIYKMFGYLFDFHGIAMDSNGDELSGLVLFPRLMKPLSREYEERCVRLVDMSERRELSDVLGEFLSTPMLEQNNG